MTRAKIKKLRTDGWNPMFHRVKNILDCADEINRPHDDYPKRVNATLDMIDYYRGRQSLSESDILKIHGHVMFDCDFRGKYRDIDVRVGNHIAPKHYLVPDLIKSLFPVKRMSDEKLIDWYIDFETVHPFNDGNGRVGGIVVACLSFAYDDYLTPADPRYERILNLK